MNHRDGTLKVSAITPLLAIVFSINFIFSSGTTMSQNQVKSQIDPRTSRKILVDRCERADLLDPSIEFFFEPEYDFYNPDTTKVKFLKAVAKDYTVVIVIGTWCGDSREQVPRFYKIADKIELDAAAIELIAVDRQKKGADIDVSPLNIVKVPTFIFYRNQKEIGRIIETPDTTLENDMLTIINNVQ